ncbi:MAG TPA: hypothetical protein VD994_01770 [Prosthecobacter sp.]|nr:hypothetical protein [Prosthecobacter sp.]
MNATSSKSDLVPLPSRVDSAFLAKHQREGEPMIIAKISGIGNVAPYEFRGHGVRAYVLRWEPKLNAHTLRVPLRLWMQNDHRLAHDLLEHDSLPLPIVVLIDAPVTPEPEVKPQAKKPTAAPTRRRTELLIS